MQTHLTRMQALWFMENRIHEKHDREARRPRIDLEKEGKKCTSAESYKLASYNASIREDHTGSRANMWLSEINRRTHTCLMDTGIHVMVCKKIFQSCTNKGKNAGSVTSMVWNTHELPGQPATARKIIGKSMGYLVTTSFAGMSR